MTILLVYNNNMIVKSQKIAYKSDKLANELRDSSEDLTKYVRTFVVTAEPKYERAYWHVLNVRNGKEARPDGRKIPLNVLMKQLGFTNQELEKLREAQNNSDQLVKKEVISMNAINGVYDVNIAKLIRPNESRRDFAIRIINDEAYHKDKATIMNPIDEVVQMVDKRTQIELTHYDILNYVYMFIAFFIVFSLFFRFIFLIKMVKQNVEKEVLLREIFETMRRSLDLNTVKNTIVHEVGHSLKASRCFIWQYDKSTDVFTVEGNSEYRLSDDIKSLIGINSKDLEIEGLTTLYKEGKEVLFSNVKQFLKENHLEGSSIERYFNRYNTKASYGIPIFNLDEMLGVLIVQYTKDTTLSAEDIDFIRIVAAQAGDAIYQAKLYQEVQNQAERERISRTIIEILRSSIDKVIIKKLFVKNLGKFLKADRVFFADYDPATKMYLPVDKDFEYLSSSNQKSLAGYNWSNPDVKQHIQPLLEKREIKISDFDKYIQENKNKNKGLAKRYEDVKSSYSFPVLHQNDIMGYFCIEFTDRIFELSEEDINRIRSICTQAGIALYHAKLYLQAQQCAISNEPSISEFSEKIEKPASEILNTSILLAQNEFERAAQIEYLDTIISSCNHLLELTKNVPKDST